MDGVRGILTVSGVVAKRPTGWVITAGTAFPYKGTPFAIGNISKVALHVDVPYQVDTHVGIMMQHGQALRGLQTGRLRVKEEQRKLNSQRCILTANEV